MASTFSSVKSSGVEQIIRSDAKRFFDAICNSSEIFPKAVPDLYSSITTPDESGTERVITYRPESPTIIKSSREKITRNSWPVFTYSIVGGDILKYCPSFVGIISIVNGDDCTRAKWTWETGVRENNKGIEAALAAIAVKTLRGLDEYLALVRSSGVEQIIRSDAKRFFDAICNSTEIFPKAVPDLYSSITTPDESGTERVITYGPESPTIIKSSREKITSNSWPVFTYSIVGGDILEYCPSFVGIISIVNGDDCTRAKWTWETGVRENNNGIEAALAAIAVKTLRGLDEYLALVRSSGVEQIIRSDAKRFFDAICNSTEIFPKAVPDLYSSITTPDESGTERVITYGPESPTIIKSSREKITSNSWPVFTYSIVGGDILEYCPSFVGIISIVNGDDCTRAKWTWETGVRENNNGIEAALAAIAVKTLRGLDEYLALVRSSGVEQIIRSDAKRFFDAICNSTEIFPKAVPDLYSSITTPDESGTERVITYGPESPTIIKSSREKITSNSWPVFTYSIVGGDILEYCPSFVGIISIVNGDDCTRAKWTWETGVRENNNGIEAALAAIAVKTLRGLDEYLALVRSSGVEQIIRSDAKRFFDAICNSTEIFPKAVPDLYSSITTPDESGTERVITYGPESPTIIKSSREKITNNSWPVFTYSIVGGDILEYCPSFVGIISIVNGDDCTRAKWTWETGVRENNNGIEAALAAFAVKTLMELDEYLAFYFSEGG